MTLAAYPLFPGVPGGMELAVILLIAILLFGANKIPKLARSTGEAMGEFKKGREAVEQELEEMRGTATGSASSSGGASGSPPETEEPPVEPETETEEAVEPESETEEER